jgi:hypothetical protein
MAIRNLTDTFASIGEFIQVYESALSKGGLFIESDRFKGDLAKEVKIDLVLPLGKRVGPLDAQVVHTTNKGDVGVRFPNISEEAKLNFRQLFEFVADVRDYLVSSGKYVTRTDFEAGMNQARADAAAYASQTGGAPIRRGRGIPVPDVRSIAPALNGAMNNRSLRDAMVQLAIEQVTGMLTVRYPDGRVRYGFWDRGGPVGWRTDPVTEDEVLGLLLYQAEQLTKEQIKESLAIMESNGSRQGEALVTMGIMTYPQLIMVLGKQNEFVLQRVMQDRQGKWSFHLLPSLPEQFLASPIKVPSLLFRALYSRARDMNSSELFELQNHLLDKYVSIEKETKQMVSEIKFQKKEAGLIEVIQASSWRVRELFSVSPLSRAMTSAVIWALDEMKLLAYEETEDLERYLARVGGRISRKKSQLQDNNFSVLELHWICLPDEVHDRYKRLKEEFKNDRYHDLSADQLSDLEQINVRLDDAFGQIETDRERRAYRAKVIEKDTIFQSAELLGNKGEMAIMRRDKREAMTCYAKATELMPNESKFKDGYRRAQAV